MSQPSLSTSKIVQKLTGNRFLSAEIFCLDTYASVSTGFALSFDKDSVHRRLPSVDGAWSEGTSQAFNGLVTDPLPPTAAGRTSMPLFGYFCSIVHILGEVHNFIRAPLLLTSVEDTTAWKTTYQRLSAKLERWYDALPETIMRAEADGWDASDGEGGMKVLVLAACLATTVRLHSALAYPPVSSPLFLPSDAAAQTCVQASVRMARLAGLVGAHAGGTGRIDERDMNPIFAWFLWIAARGLVAHAFIKVRRMLPSSSCPLLRVLTACPLSFSARP